MAMQEPDLTQTQPEPPATAGSPRRGIPPRLQTLGLVTAGILLLFALPLFDLVRFSLANNLYSHILLVPAISLYLVRLKRAELRIGFEPARGLALGLALAGGALVAGYGAAVLAGSRPDGADRLSILILSLLCFLWSGTAWCLGTRALQVIAFPLAFLVFAVPMPSAMEAGVEAFLQHGSASATYLLLKLAGTPVFRDGTTFQLPGFALDVAPECSGIRSTLVLFITALLAAHFFLRKPWTKAVLAGSVIVLGIARNAVRIFTLAQLCLHVDPEILHSNLHRRGGPLFFALSLIPFFLLLWWLRRMECRTKKPKNPS